MFQGLKFKRAVPSKDHFIFWDLLTVEYKTALSPTQNDKTPSDFLKVQKSVMILDAPNDPQMRQMYGLLTYMRLVKKGAIFSRGCMAAGKYSIPWPHLGVSFRWCSYKLQIP